jgi:hypothetical protein
MKQEIYRAATNGYCPLDIEKTGVFFIIIRLSLWVWEGQKE